MNINHHPPAICTRANISEWIRETYNVSRMKARVTAIAVSLFCVIHVRAFPTPSALQVSAHSGQEESVETTITRAAELLSYQCNEKKLRKALAVTNDAGRITHRVRGQLEDFVDSTNDNILFRRDGTTTNVVDRFLATLAAVTSNTQSNNNIPTATIGLSICRSLLRNTGDISVSLSSPPTRSLIGTLDGMDISIKRDKDHVDHRFTLVFSSGRAKSKQIARLLVEVQDESNSNSNSGSAVVSIRGLFVQEQYRHKGLSTKIIAVMCDFCHRAFGVYPVTCVMNKPLLCLAFSSLGFTPESDRWPALVAVSQDDPEATLVSPATDGPALGPLFPHSVRKAQKLKLVEMLDSSTKSKRVHVRTRFLPPAVMDPVNNRLKASSYKLYSARIVAFLSTFEAGRGPMMRQSRALQDGKSMMETLSTTTRSS